MKNFYNKIERNGDLIDPANEGTPLLLFWLFAF